MRTLIFSLFVLIILFACKDEKKVHSENAESISAQPGEDDSIANFFPVTSYLKGEIFSIKNGGVTPVRKIIIGKHTDSSWVKMNELDAAFAPFLFPVIDTANLKGTFIENKFLDQTLNAFTFTYDPVNKNTEAFAFRHWDVYVDPDNNKVKRIYLVKKEGPDTEIQLTWQSGKWCKIVTIINKNGNKAIDKEEKISWSFD